MEEILIDGDVFMLKWNEDGTGAYESKNNNGEFRFDTNITQKTYQHFIQITELNKPNPKIIAEVLKRLYDQGVRAK